MDLDYTPICPLPNIGPCAGERCNFWDPEEGCQGEGVAFASDPSLEPHNMNTLDQTLCPISDMGFCIYEKCPYWDATRQECDADCLQSEESSQAQSSDGPCNIYWTEDHD